MDEKLEIELAWRLRVAVGALNSHLEHIKTLALARESVKREAERSLNQLIKGLLETAKEAGRLAPQLSDLCIRSILWSSYLSPSEVGFDDIYEEGARRGYVERFDEHGALVNKPSWRLVEESLEDNRRTRAEAP